jgi:hypothetical protein
VRTEYRIKTIYSFKKLKFFEQKLFPFVCHDFHEGHSCSRKSLLNSSPDRAFSFLKFLNFFPFCGSLLALLDPDPGPTDLIETDNKKS